MPDPATVHSLRTARDTARARFDSRLERVQGDVEKRGVGSRIAGKLHDDVKRAATYALDVARDNKGIIVGTLAAVALWLLRRPLTAWVEAHFGDIDLPEGAEASFEDAIDG